MAAFDGSWKVRRESGLLLPFGIRKKIRGATGWTKLAFLPILPFRVKGLTFDYHVVPIRDELSLRPDGSIGGAGYFLGLPFCRFRMEPA